MRAIQPFFFSAAKLTGSLLQSKRIDGDDDDWYIYTQDEERDGNVVVS